MRAEPGQPQSRDALRLCEPFAELPKVLVDSLLNHMSERAYAPGEPLIRQGEPGDCVMVLLEGHARVSLHDDRGRRDLARLGPRDIVGEMALVLDEPRTADVVAETAVRALSLPAGAFQDLATRHPELGMVITSVVAERLGGQRVDGLGGKTVGDYHIVRCLGRGGMGVVYEAEGPEGIVALKMMSHRLLYEKGAMARFEREASTLQRLRHENIARVYRCFTAYRTSFIAMEFCDGPVLSQLIVMHHPLPEEQARKIIGQIASALHYMHGEGVVHRDLKPTNLMLTRKGLVKLTDFGLAKRLGIQTGTSITEAHTLLGTPLYMAPEQLAGEPCGAPADIYALGCVAFQVLAGHPPFRATNFMELAQEKLSFVLPPRESIGRGISAEMHGFLEGCMKLDPKHRIADSALVAAWGKPVDPALIEA